MIIFDLKCAKGHKFDGWFKDRQSFVDQNAKKLVACPVCNSCSVDIIPSSLTIMGKDSRASGKLGGAGDSPLKVLQELQRYIDKNFEDVGDKFADVALKIHSGEEERRNIKGTTTPQEDEHLREEGIQFVKIPIPKMNS